MEAGFQNAMDNLASNNILNFDANAFVMGTQPRYVGDLDGDLHLPLDAPLPLHPERSFNITPGQQIHGSPRKDVFSRESSGKSSNYSFKEILFGGLAAFLAAVGGVKLYNYLRSRRATAVATPAPATPAAAASGGKVRTFFTNVWNKIKALPKWAKITGGVAIGIGALYVAAKTVFSGNNNIPPEMQSRHSGH